MRPCKENKYKNKKTKNFRRYCKRCGEIFTTDYRNSKACKACHKVRKWKPVSEYKSVFIDYEKELSCIKRMIEIK